MQIKVDDIEAIIKPGVNSVLLTNSSNNVCIILSRNSNTNEIYLEYNDQSMGSNNAMENAYIDGNTLVLSLNEDGKKLFGVSSVSILISCNTLKYEELLKSLRLICETKFQSSNTPFNFIDETQGEFDSITYLNLSGKSLISPPDNLGEYINLEKLIVLDNPELDLEATVIILSGMPRLRKLHISIFGSIPPSLSKILSLEFLHIEGNADFTTMPGDIGNLKKLSYIYLQSRSNIILPDHFADLVSLEELHVRANCWSLPTHFYKLTKLKSLDLFDCDIQKLPEEMAFMTSLENLYLGFDERRDISSVFETISRITSLRNLEIILKCIPENISKCKHLEQIIIYGQSKSDYMLEIPKGIEVLTQLKKLQFIQCNNIVFSTEIKEIKSINELSFIECNFQYLPEGISLFRNLKSLIINECLSLTTLPSSLASLTLMKSLSIYDAPLLTSLPESYKSITFLVEIIIPEYQQILNIPDHWLEKLAQHNTINQILR